MGNTLFDYKAASETLRVPPEVMRDLEDAARREFGNDEMLMELHVLRAVRAYANSLELKQ